MFVMHVYCFIQPRKKALDSGGKGSTLPDVYRKIDLRLEAKLSAEVSVHSVHWSFA